MTDPCPLFVELCCGSAAVTLRLIGGANARPPISYMGAKTGYAQAILHVLGLRSGQGADACVLVEAGPWARAWRLLTTPEGCRAVAEVVRGWIGEDARALWERLRAEGAAEGEGAEGVGAWLVLWEQTYDGCKAERAGKWSSGGFFLGSAQKLGRNLPAHAAGLITALSALFWPPTHIIEGDVAGVEPRDVAAWLMVAAGTHGGSTSGGFKADRPAGVMTSRARSVDPALAPEIARYLSAARKAAGLSRAAVDRAVGGNTICAFWEGRTYHGEVCYRIPSWANWATLKDLLSLDDRFDDALRPTPGDWSVNVPGAVEVADRLDASVPFPPTTIAQADVAQVRPGTLPPGTVVYFDPPYQKTTGYAHGLSRAQVLDVARRWSDAGAVVCVSEAEPLPLEGWHHVEITGCRVGQKRTFSRQKREWLTLNRAPAWTPATQGELL